MLYKIFNTKTMKNTILYQDESVQFQLNPLIPCIEFVPNGLPKSTEHLQGAFTMLVNFCSENIGAHKGLGVMIDMRKTDGITSQDNEWVASHIVPKFIALGISKIAVVDGVSELSHITAEESQELMVRMPVQNRLFKEPEIAWAWLKS
jgi:hypothetical protein